MYYTIVIDMIEEKTLLEKERETDFEKIKDKIVIIVENNYEGKYKVKSVFYSLDNALHKIKLDIMLMASYGLFDEDKNIKVYLKER